MNIEHAMRAEDLKIESVNNTPKGGQHVGIVSTGIRITHIPSGISVECDCERSQLKNRDLAMAILAQNLAEKEVEK